VSEWFGRHQNWHLQFGIAAFIIAGVHLGADRIDDGCFAVLNFVDAGFDDLVARFFTLLHHTGLMSIESARDYSLGFADLVDVEARETASRWVAVGLELWVDFLLGRAALSYREATGLGAGFLDMPVELIRTIKTFARRFKELMDLEFILLPLSLLIGLIASSYIFYVVAGETFDQVLVDLFGPSGAVQPISEILAVVLTVMVTWSLGFRAITSTLRYVEKRAEQARHDFVRRFRGVTLLATVLPVCALGSLFATPLAGLY